MERERGGREEKQSRKARKGKRERNHPNIHTSLVTRLSHVERENDSGCIQGFTTT